MDNGNEKSGGSAEQASSKAEFWKRKLADYLHDPPSKCLDRGCGTPAHEVGHGHYQG